MRNAGVFLFFLFFSIFAMGQETFLDNFNTVPASYAENNGSQNFSSNWVENVDGGSASSGKIQITSSRLRFEDITRNSENILRSVDLTDASSATLSFDWQTSGLDGGSDATSEYLSIQVSTDGLNYTTLGTFHGSQTNSFSQDILAYASANTRFRLYNESTWAWGDWEAGEFVYIDNFTITASFGPMILASDIVVNEGAGSATFTVLHDGINTSSSFTVDYTISEESAIQGTDYSTSSGIYTGTLSFNGIVGDTEQVTVLITDDSILEVSEAFVLSFNNASDGSVDISDTATGTIDDNESEANDVRPYEERYSMNIDGNFIMRGNTNLQCISNCPGTPTSNNPSVVMGFSDVDGNPSTINSSSCTISIPVGATVEYAALYWGGAYSSTFTGITDPAGLMVDEVKLRTPGSTTYNTVTADQRNIETAIFSGWHSFLSFADVTSLVQSGGNGDYFVADIALATGSAFTGPYGGWTMVIVYNDNTEKSRNISIWDGFNFFGFGANDTFTVTGLLTPSTGAFESSVGYFGFDGEASSSGDFVTINGSAISNALNPNDNTLNGTISEYGIDVGNRNPNFNYSWGVDIDVFDTSGFVPNSATDMDVVLGSSSEGIWGGVLVTSNEIAFPTVATSSFDLGTITLGNESTLTITIENPSNGVSLSNLVLSNNLPSGMTISTSPDATSSCGGTISAITGANTFSVSGLSLSAGNSCTFTVDVTTSTDGTFSNTITPSNITNDQNIPLSGSTTSDLIVLPLPDNDNDSIADIYDLDDDNDGIPDTDELSTVISSSQNDCTGETVLDFSSAATLVSGTALQQGAVYRISNVTSGTDALVTIVFTNNATVANIDNNGSDANAFRPQTAFNLTNPGDRGFVEYNIQFVNTGGTTPVTINRFFMNFNDIDGNNNYAEQAWADNPTSYIISNPTELTISSDSSWVIGTAGTNEFSGAGNGNPEVNFGVNYNSKSEINIRVGGEARVAGASAGGRQHNIEFACLTNYVNPSTYGIDSDSDGIANHLDLDSDNDGIYDAVEAGHNQSHTNGIVIGTYGSNGLVNGVENTPESGILNYSILNSDSSDNPDYLDTDSDNDSCSDANEAYANSNADAGDNNYYGTGNPPATNGDGTVNAASYSEPADGNSNTVYDYRESQVPLITVQPIDQIVCPGCNISFSSTASNVDSYQWQYFNGTSWENLTDVGVYSGSNTATLTITNATVELNGNQYRILVSNTGYICDSVTSNTVTLTVNVSTVITNRRITYRVRKN